MTGVLRTTVTPVNHMIIFSQGIVNIVEETQCMKNDLTLEDLSSAKEVVKSEKAFVNGEIDECDFLFEHACYKHLINGIRSFCKKRKRS